jgi:hypothetical protein
VCACAEGDEGGGLPVNFGEVHRMEDLDNQRRDDERVTLG